MNTTPLFPQAVVEAVKKAMDAANVDAPKLAELSGIAYTTLWRRLQGKGKPFDVAELDQIAEALGVSVVELTTPKEIAS